MVKSNSPKFKEYQVKDITLNVAMGPFGSRITKDNFVSEGVPVIKGQNLSDGRFNDEEFSYLTEEKADDLSSSNAFPDDLVFTHRGTLGQVGILPAKFERYVVSQSQMKLTCDPEKVDPMFFYYYFCSKGKDDLLKHESGSGVPAISSPSTTLKNLTVEIPSLAYQKKVASILSAFDDLIETNTRRIEILEEMARRIYREWFVHFRYPGYQDDEFVDSGTDEFDAVPEGWDLKIMDEILEHYIGGTWGQEEPEGEENNPAYVIRGTDIPGGRSGNVDDIPLRFHKQSYINSRKLQHGDIVFEVSGGSKDQPVGRAMLITDTFLSELDCDDVVHASFCKLLRSDKSILKPEILYLHIREIYDDRRIMKYQVQSTGITNFKFTFFAENKQMFIPPMELQEKFQEKVSPLFKQMYILGKQINRLKETRDLLLPKLISGKIDVEELYQLGNQNNVD